MSLLSSLGVVGTTYNNTAPVIAQKSHLGSFWSMLWLPLLLIFVFYFLLIRPQTKRAKEHRQLLEGISLGDEVLTTGGLVARVSRLKDNFIVLEVGNGTEITVQKNSIASILPNGTIDSI